MSNNHLIRARDNSNDEFYTQYEDIAKEIPYYKEQLVGKIIYCNCDNPLYSNFYKYLKEHFSEYKLKQLIATHIGLYEYYSYKPKKYIFDGQTEIIEELNTNGDFRSYECINILQTADIVITNPPFSLFREFVELMYEFNKKFLIIGNINAISLKNFADYFISKKISLGYNRDGMCFNTSINKTIKFSNCSWFTNIKYIEPEFIELTKTYTETDYPKYINFDIISVKKIVDIPKDYFGLMGVPISFISKYNSNQFELLGNSVKYTLVNTINGKKTQNRRFYLLIDNKPVRQFDCLVIRRKN